MLMRINPNILYYLPFILIGLILVFSRIDGFWYYAVMCMPISLQFDQVIGSASVVLPSDFMAIALMLLFALKLPVLREDVNRFITHPICVWMILYISWMLITTLTSSLLVISLKYWLSTFWYVSAFFFLSIIIFRDQRAMQRWLWVISIPLLFVLIRTILKHYAEGLSLKASYTIMQPFYKEHTGYAASIAVFAVIYPLLLLQGRGHWLEKVWLAILSAVSILATVLSFSRGAWLGVMAAFGLYIFVVLWEKYRQQMIILLIVGVLAGAYMLNSRIYFIESSQENRRNKQFNEHLVSVINVRNDVSNLERINRWIAALRMVEERPIFGFGPGTYAMKYDRFQLVKYKTYISTDRGLMGTTHSEYLLAASEMGIPGMIIVFGLYITSLVRGVRGYWRSRNNQTKLLYAVGFGGLTTFYVHAIVNNFLDQDKVAIPIFICLALIVALDRFHKDEA
jgi:O-antigen ligase